MSRPPFNYPRLFSVFLYAAAMAWVESAVVFDLRTMVNRIVPYQADPLPLVGGLGPVELVREAATLIMLLAVGVLAGRTWRARFGYAALAFGAWDILYYLFLKVICGWPHSLLDWDILFLLPLPWWGPVLAPMCIALLMMVWGVLATRDDPGIGSSTAVEVDKGNWGVLATRDDPGIPVLGEVQPLRRGWPDGPRAWLPWAFNLTGMGLALYVFMYDTLRVSNQGVEVVRQVLPRHFHWPLFSVALLLMAVPIYPLCARGGSAAGPGRTLNGPGKPRWSGDCSGALT